jgi:hypothetical protein
MNRIFVIARGQYEELGTLLIWVTLVNLVVPTLTVVLLHLLERWRSASNTN